MDKSKLQKSSTSSSMPAVASSPMPKMQEGAKKDLEKAEYFHGFRPRKDVQHLLKEPNDFLVRVSDGGGGAAEIIVSVMNDKREHMHLTLCHENGLWQFTLIAQALKKMKKKPSHSDAENGKLRTTGFPSVCDLIAYYKDHKAPGKIYLKRPVLRPHWQITHDQVDYSVADRIGSGNFCHVYKGKYKRTDQDVYEVAVKVCHEGKMSNDSTEESKEARKAMISEAQVMSNYIHENIILLHGVALAHQPILIVMEFCSGGNLESHLAKQGDKIEQGELLVYALEAARGLRYLHDQNCVHRDVAARNCLISSKGIVKISDFGLSMVIKEIEKPEADEPENNGQVPVRWMAPESLKKPVQYSVKSDVWSYGVLLYEIYNDGIKPWPEEPVKKIATMIRRCEMPAFPEKSPKEVKEVVKTIWVADPKTRPTVGKLYRKLYGLIQKSVCLPPNDLKLWAVNRIPGVVRTDNGLAPRLGDHTDSKDEGQSEHGSRNLPVTGDAKKN